MDTLYYILFLISWGIGVFFNYIDLILITKSIRIYTNIPDHQYRVNEKFYKKIIKEDDDFEIFGGFILGLIPFLNIILGMYYYSLRTVELNKHGNSYLEMLIDLQNVK